MKTVKCKYPLPKNGLLLLYSELGTPVKEKKKIKCPPKKRIYWHLTYIIWRNYYDYHRVAGYCYEWSYSTCKIRNGTHLKPITATEEAVMGLGFRCVPYRKDNKFSIWVPPFFSVFLFFKKPIFVCKI